MLLRCVRLSTLTLSHPNSPFELLKPTAKDPNCEREKKQVPKNQGTMASKLWGRALGGFNIENTPYVVLLGDVGTGKSTIVEKVSNVTNLASDGDTSVTKSSTVFWSIDGSLLIADTPGSNAIEDKLKHNLGIAGALNYLPVSKVFILVKAETRLDSVVDNIRKYSDRFVEFDPDILGVLITHMDTVSWSPTR